MHSIILLSAQLKKVYTTTSLPLTYIVVTVNLAHYEILGSHSISSLNPRSR